MAIPQSLLAAKRCANDVDELWWNPNPGSPGTPKVLIGKADDGAAHHQ